MILLFYGIKKQRESIIDDLQGQCVYFFSQATLDQAPIVSLARTPANDAQ